MKSIKLIAINSVVVAAALLFGSGCSQQDDAARAQNQQMQIEYVKLAAKTNQMQADYARVTACLQNTSLTSEQKSQVCK